MNTGPDSPRPAPYALLCDIADYVLAAPAFSDEASDTARHWDGVLKGPKQG